MKKGKLTIFIGTPYSGKSTKLIKIANSLFNRSCVIFSPRGANSISRKLGVRKPNRVVTTLTLPDEVPNTSSSIFIDELQQFRNLTNIRKYLLSGIDVYATCIPDMNCQFILQMADKVEKLPDAKVKDRPGLRVMDKDHFYNTLAFSISATPESVILYTDRNPDDVYKHLRLMTRLDLQDLKELLPIQKVTESGIPEQWNVFFDTEITPVVEKRMKSTYNVGKNVTILAKNSNVEGRVFSCFFPIFRNDNLPFNA